MYKALLQFLCQNVAGNTFRSDLTVKKVWVPGMDQYVLSQAALLSPSQCPECEPVPGNVDLDITKLLLFTKILSNALEWEDDVFIKHLVGVHSFIYHN